jgi:hypothetical protein
MYRLSVALNRVGGSKRLLRELNVLVFLWIHDGMTEEDLAGVLYIAPSLAHCFSLSWLNLLVSVLLKVVPNLHWW